MADPILAMQTRIKGLSDIQALLSNRVYRVGSVPPAPTVPYILLPGTISDIGDTCTSSSDNGHTRVQVSIFASTDGTAEQVSQILKKQVPCGQTILPAGDTYLRVISIDDAGSVSDEDSDARIYMRHRDFIIESNY